MVIAGAVCGVVAEVGGEALSHGAWADGAALPFQEESAGLLPLFIMTKASGLMARTLPLWRKYRDALCGGSSWTISQPSTRARSTVSA